MGHFFKMSLAKYRPLTPDTFLPIIFHHSQMIFLWKINRNKKKKKKDEDEEMVKAIESLFDLGNFLFFSCGRGINVGIVIVILWNPVLMYRSQFAALSLSRRLNKIARKTLLVYDNIRIVACHRFCHTATAAYDLHIPTPHPTHTPTRTLLPRQ